MPDNDEPDGLYLLTMAMCPLCLGEFMEGTPVELSRVRSRWKFLCEHERRSDWHVNVNEPKKITLTANMASDGLT